MEGQGGGQGPRKHNLMAGWRLGGLRGWLGQRWPPPAHSPRRPSPPVPQAAAPGQPEGLTLKANKPSVTKHAVPA